MSDMLRQYTRLLRRPDEISRRALLLGMRGYRPDEEKATHYTGAAFDARLGEVLEPLTKKTARAQAEMSPQ